MNQWCLIMKRSVLGFLFLHKTSWPRCKFGRKGFIHLILSTLLLITKGSQDRNSSRSGYRSWYRGRGGMFLTGLLPLACSACSLIEPKNTSPEVVPPTMMALPAQSLIEKMPHSWISWRHFPNWSSFLCDNSNLCQVDTQNQQVQPARHKSFQALTEVLQDIWRHCEPRDDVIY